jgi:hypothetical protein
VIPNTFASKTVEFPRCFWISLLAEDARLLDRISSFHFHEPDRASALAAKPLYPMALPVGHKVLSLAR